MLGTYSRWQVQLRMMDCMRDDPDSAASASPGTDCKVTASAYRKMWHGDWISQLCFQAEVGIRHYKVTGVQTCALPIWDLCGLHEVAGADLVRRQPCLARDMVDEALQQVRRLRPARAAIGVGRHGVGHHALHVHVDGRSEVLRGGKR